MKKILAFTRSLISLATSLHLKSLSATIKAADRTADKAVQYHQQTERVATFAANHAKAASDAANQALKSAGLTYKAAKAEAQKLRPGAVLA